MDFEKEYFSLFNAMTRAIEKIADGNYGDARQILILAQQKAEEAYMADAKE